MLSLCTIRAVYPSATNEYALLGQLFLFHFDHLTRLGLLLLKIEYVFLTFRCNPNH